MTYSSLARPTLALLTAAALAACSSSGASTGSSAPAPASSPSTTVAAAPANAMPAGVTAATIAMGDSIFHARGCKNCHGADAKGARNGPDLTSGHFMHVSGAYDDFVRVITSGIPADSIKEKTHTLAMPPRGGRPTPLSDDQIHAVAAYVWSLNHK